MKKVLMLLFAAVVLLLPACNEDATENDVALSGQLKGTWSTTSENSEMLSIVSYRFDDTKFTYANSMLNKGENKERYYTVSGSWSVYKGILQLSYDLESLRMEGFSETEQKTYYDQMSDSNLLLKEMNDNGRPFGSGMEFDIVNGQEILRLDGVNGYFVRESR